MKSSEVNVNLKGKNAIVTGATKGIGRAIVLSLIKSGAKVIAVSRTEKDLQELQEVISDMGGECITEACDISKVSEIKDLFTRLRSSVNKIDILINSAGLNIQNHVFDVTEEDWDTMMNTNLKGAFFMSREAAKIMKEHEEGKIINITSQMAFVGYYKRVGYCASKGGLTQATKAMAVELAPYNIKVNCVAPTFIKTPLTEPMFEDKDFLEEVKNRIPLGKVGEPQDVTGAVLFLASDSANLVTGSSVVVDGGWIAW
ncbi:SDR family NAD(P)-dependent oxidoreductase [Natranaerofaba carboxydovora]|uniref:SDR family NAD(P)-dependent oxidoreductase n=1 Tax=Natranaerofaba carboxydovora TaxID=2742683 RepID=UPI001F144B1D|nr:glucose 1-dehydrogenase [Natranaerofaba carboxydovora]UMZ73634.1 2-dehydro-3-deoxy-D-gluconate 5-dehydrogenase [Natranaerofaba carboxydovora]